MSKRHYSPEQKEHAILALQHYDGDIGRVSRLLNISNRTLYRWRKEMENSNQWRDLPKNFISSSPPISPISPSPEPPASYTAAFGMTREELEKALEFEYVKHPYEDLRKALMADVQKLQRTIADDPDSAHIRSLAVSRMLGDVLHLDQMCRIEKPQLSIIKYEFPDGTFHDIPPWSHGVHNRAMQAYWTVIEQAKQQHYEDYLARTADPNPLEPSQTDDPQASDEPDWDATPPTLEELFAERFKPEDFVPKHTGYHKYFLGEDPSPRPKNADHFSKKDDNPTP
jgi:hypothetical protein